MTTERYELEGHVFEWDRSKNLSNIKKHGITFKIAARTFFDPNAEIYEDEKHSLNEDRFILIGVDESNRLLTVCHCHRGDDAFTTRIISARKATKHEESLYEGEL